MQGKFIFTKADGTRYDRIYEADVMTSETPRAGSSAHSACLCN